MRILIIDEAFPYPLHSGKSIRTYNLMRRLAQRHSISYVAFGNPNSDGYRHCAACNMDPIAVRELETKKAGVLFYMHLAANVLSRWPYTVSSHYHAAFKKELSSAINARRPDILIAEWTPYAAYFRGLDDVIKLIVAHNIETNIWRGYADNERNVFRKYYIGLQRDKMAVFERGAFLSADAATVVSKADAAVIRQWNPHLSLEVIDNGVDVSYFAPAPVPPKQWGGLVFTGSMDWRPNQDGAVYFVREIHPVLREMVPDIRAVFVGRNPPKHIVRLAETPGIIVTGTVEDVRSYIRDAAVYIVPLRVGGGSRLKILEAMAMGKPIVSTTLGAEGLDVTDNENIILADTPKDFAAGIVRFLKNPELAARLGKAGRQLVERYYSWDHIADKYEQFLLGLVKPL